MARSIPHPKKGSAEAIAWGKRMRALRGKGKRRRLNPTTKHLRGPGPMTQYLSEIIDFGGEKMERGDVYRWFKEQGWPYMVADRWMQGYDTAHGLKNPRRPPTRWWRSCVRKVGK